MAETLIIILIVLIIIFLAIGIYFLVKSKSTAKYRNFVLDYSMALREIKAINKEYNFYNIPNCNMSNSYDNEDNYNNISLKDYLTYQLVSSKDKIYDAMDKTFDNNHLYKQYLKEIGKKCVFNRFDTDKTLRNKEELLRIEKKIVSQHVRKVVTDFKITVNIYLTNLTGFCRDSKSATFNDDEIMDLMAAVERKNGDYYLDDDVWQSICRVERGKVSNKMRFEIFERDGYRCKNCGSRNNLEIDHIIPISKGGKSTYDNLQTLCHNCNYNKGSDTIYY